MKQHLDLLLHNKPAVFTALPPPSARRIWLHPQDFQGPYLIGPYAFIQVGQYLLWHVISFSAVN